MKLRAKFIVLLLLPLTVISLLFGVTHYQRWHMFDQQTNQHQEYIAQLISVLAINALFDDTEEIDTIFKLHAEDHLMYLKIYKGNSPLPTYRLGGVVDRSAMNVKVRPIVSNVSNLYESQRANALGRVEIGFNNKKVMLQKKKIIQEFLMLLLLCAVVIYLFYHFINRMIFVRVQRYVQDINASKLSRFNREVSIDGDDELSVLGKHLNLFIHSVRSGFDQNHELNKRLIKTHSYFKQGMLNSNMEIKAQVAELLDDIFKYPESQMPKSALVDRLGDITIKAQNNIWALSKSATPVLHTENHQSIEQLIASLEATIDSLSETLSLSTAVSIDTEPSLLDAVVLVDVILLINVVEQYLASFKSGDRLRIIFECKACGVNQVNIQLQIQGNPQVQTHSFYGMLKEMASLQGLALSRINQEDTLTQQLIIHGPLFKQAFWNQRRKVRIAMICDEGNPSINATANNLLNLHIDSYQTVADFGADETYDMLLICSDIVGAFDDVQHQYFRKLSESVALIALTPYMMQENVPDYFANQLVFNFGYHALFELFESLEN